MEGLQGVGGENEGFSAWALMYTILHTQGLKYHIRHMRGSSNVQSAWGSCSGGQQCCIALLLAKTQVAYSQVCFHP